MELDLILAVRACRTVCGVNSNRQSNKAPVELYTLALSSGYLILRFQDEAGKDAAILDSFHFDHSALAASLFRASCFSIGDTWRIILAFQIQQRGPAPACCLLSAACPPDDVPDDVR